MDWVWLHSWGTLSPVELLVVVVVVVVVGALSLACFKPVPWYLKLRGWCLGVGVK